MKAEEWLKNKLQNRTALPRLLIDQVIMEERETLESGTGKLLGTMRHCIPLSTLAEHFRAQIENPIDDSNPVAKRAAIRDANKIMVLNPLTSKNEPRVKIPQHILDDWEAKNII